MVEQTPFQVAPYAALAAIYNRAGFADYARSVVLEYINSAQGLDWAGRSVLDLGCGTGITSWILSERGFRVTGIDASPAMLAEAKDKAPDQDQDDDVVIALAPPQFVQQDIRTLDVAAGSVDMVMATGNVINELGSLRELQQTFARIASALDQGRMFVFDVLTIQGLANGIGTRDHVVFDEPDLTVLARHEFSFETLSNTIRYTIFQQTGGEWQRHDETHIVRGFPTQGIVALLDRCGLETLALVDPEMMPFDPARDEYGRAVYFARRKAQ